MPNPLTRIVARSAMSATVSSALSTTAVRLTVVPPSRSRARRLGTQMHPGAPGSTAGTTPFAARPHLTTVLARSGAQPPAFGSGRYRSDPDRQINGALLQTRWLRDQVTSACRAHLMYFLSSTVTLDTVARE
jgi:hypothetical protein